MTLYQRGVSGLQGLATADEIAAYTSAYGGFHDEAFFDLYEKKALGPRLWEGGDGTAERRVLELVRLDVEFRIRSIQYAVRTWSPDLVFHYTPTTDSAGHLWIGALDPEGCRYDPALAARLWPIYEEVFRQEDRWLGHLIEAAGSDGAVCLVSDRGDDRDRHLLLSQHGSRAARRTGGHDWKEDRSLAHARAFLHGAIFFVTVNGIESDGRHREACRSGSRPARSRGSASLGARSSHRPAHRSRRVPAR